MRRSSLGQGMRKAAVALIVACALLFAGTPAYAAVTQEQLESHVVEGLNPANTKVNLFDYDTGKGVPAIPTRWEPPVRPPLL